MEQNKDFFQNYIFDQTFSSYLKEMRMQGEWGGNLEIQVKSSNSLIK